MINAAASPPIYGAGLAPQALEGSNNQTAGPSMSGQVFWAYVEAGGSLDLTVAFRNRVDGGSATTASIHALSPTGVQFDHSAPTAPSDPMPALHILGLTDTQAGVWRITFEDGVASGDHDAGIATWGITPRTASGAAQKGRVFTEEYTQTVQATRPIDPNDPWDRTWSETLYFLNRHGVTYEGTLRRYNPIQGAVTASPRGVLAPDGSSRHASASFHDPSASVDSTRYRIFFEQPDPAMPDNAQFAARGVDWLGRNYRDPLIADITHTPTASTTDAPWAGSIAWTVTGAVGAARVELDTNGDGTSDRILDAPSGAPQVVWDGQDSAGTAIPAGVDVTAWIVMTEVGEVHFTLADVEQLAGGLEVTALSGPQAGAKRLSWDDTGLGPKCDTNTDPNAVPCASRPSPLKATDVDSTGGVHAWSRATVGTGGWGDARYIDNWTTTTTNATATAVLVGPRIHARDDNAATVSGRPVTIAVLGNDTGASPGATVELTESTVSNCATAHENWKVNGDAVVTFTPEPGWYGDTTCRYRVTNPDGTTATAVITVIVKNTLTLVPDTATTNSSTKIRIPVLDNDQDVDKLVNISLSMNYTRKGTWELNSDKTLTFIPNPRFHGTASVSYTVVEAGGLTRTAHVTVKVKNVASPVNDKSTTPAGKPTTIAVLANDRTVDPDATVSLSKYDRSDGAWHVNRDGTVTFTPTSGFVGTTSATYTVTEADGTTGTATVTATVGDPVGDPVGDAAHNADPEHSQIQNLGGPRLGLGILGIALVASGAAAIALVASGAAAIVLGRRRREACG